jgi:prolyl-tRNA synthetase
MAKAPVVTPQGEDFPRWYQDVVAKAALADNGPVRGTMVVLPYGYAIWERIQAEMDARIKACGAKNCYFPLFIPESYLHKEAEHVEGFAPELAVVTTGGGKELEEPVVVRPTSETIINTYFSKWVQSYRDLPVLINQWANVVRWELRPRLFLRTSEFLWQEGHTCHATCEDAKAYAEKILWEAYTDLMVQVLAIPVLPGRKTVRERFPGAINTLACEAMMRDGKALQMGTSHELGQNFARVFDTTYSTEQGTLEHVWQTSWGTSTRMVGGVIMAHGDDHGLRLPPNLAPVQAVVIVVRGEEGAGEAAAALARELEMHGVRVELDDRTDVGFGRRVVDWELKGVPVRIEVGPRDLTHGSVTLVRRDTNEKGPTPILGLPKHVAHLLTDMQAGMLAEATALRDARIRDVASVDEAVDACRDGWGRIDWQALRAVDGEAALREHGITVRCLQKVDGSLPDSEDEPDTVAFVARAY